MENKYQKPKSDVTFQALEKRWKIPITDIVALPKQKEVENKRLVDFSKLREIVTEHADKIEDNDGIMELLPDLHIVKETLIANILSPVDLQDIKLNIGIHKDAPTEMAEVIREHFSTKCDISSKMGLIIGEALFTKGAHILLPIPPSAIRKIIKDNTYGLESANGLKLLTIDVGTMKLPNIGIIHTKNNNNTQYALESFDISLMRDKLNPETADETINAFTKSKDIEISDNILYLLYPEIKDNSNKNKLKQTLKHSYGIENLVSKPSTSNSYKDRSVKDLPFMEFALDKENIDEFHPVVLNLPYESVIPVHKPGQPREAVGYYVFIDVEGNPLHLNITVNKFREMNNKLDKLMKEQVNSNTVSLGVSYPNQGAKNTNQINENNLLLAAYSNQFEKELKEAIENGITNQKIEIGNPGELYRIMFARQLEKQKTRVIFVPAEMMSYIAFNYDSKGRGESLLDKTKLYASFRAILMFASVIAGVKSSINRSLLTITLDDDDPDPQSTVETIINEFVAMQASGLPLGRLAPLDIVDSLQKAGTQIKITGNRYPGTSMELVEAKREITPPDSNLIDMLKDIHWSACWVNRETVEKANDIEFASTITTANNMQNKRFSLARENYIAQLSDFFKKYIYLGGPLYRTLKNMYDEYLVELEETKAKAKEEVIKEKAKKEKAKADLEAAKQNPSVSEQNADTISSDESSTDGTGDMGGDTDMGDESGEETEIPEEGDNKDKDENKKEEGEETPEDETAGTESLIPLITDDEEEDEEPQEDDKPPLTFEEIIESITVILPKADNAVITTQQTEYKQYSDFITDVIDNYINEGMLKDFLHGEDLGPGIEDVKTSLLCLLKRNYLKSKNMLPELEALIADSDDNVGDQLGQHNEKILKLVGKVLKHVAKAENLEEISINVLKAEITPPEMPEIVDGGTGSDNDMGGMPNDNGDGGNEFGGGTDGMGSDESSDESSTSADVELPPENEAGEEITPVPDEGTDFNESSSSDNTAEAEPDEISTDETPEVAENNPETETPEVETEMTTNNTDVKEPIEEIKSEPVVEEEKEIPEEETTPVTDSELNKEEPIEEEEEKPEITETPIEEPISDKDEIKKSEEDKKNAVEESEIKPDNETNGKVEYEKDANGKYKLNPSGRVIIKKNKVIIPR